MKPPVRLIAYVSQPTASWGAPEDEPTAQHLAICDTVRRPGWRLIDVVYDLAPERVRLPLVLARLNRKEANVLVVKKLTCLADRYEPLERIHAEAKANGWMLLPIGMGVPLGELTPFKLHDLQRELLSELVRQGIGRRLAAGKSFGRPRRGDMGGGQQDNGLVLGHRADS
jgi:hypothetical protein